MADALAWRKASYGLARETRLPYARAVEATTEELKAEGFGILTEIDVRATLEKKLGVAFPRYVILGACNPPLAHKALSAEADIGLLLPCNVVVAEAPSGGSTVAALRPTRIFSSLVETPGVEEVARDAEARLTRALDRVAART